MSNYRKQQRKAEIREVRENARKAFYEGKHIQSCPYQYCDRMQWEEEFLRLKYMEEEKQRNSQMEMLADLIESMTETKEKRCSFCKAKEDEVVLLIKEGKTHICEKCVAKCVDIIVTNIKANKVEKKK